MVYIPVCQVRLNDGAKTITSGHCPLTAAGSNELIKMTLIDEAPRHFIQLLQEMA